MCGWSISTSRINHPNHLFSSFVKSLDGMNKSPAAKDHRPNHSDHSWSWPKSCHSGPPWSLQVISTQHVALSIYFQQGSLIFQNKCWQYKEWSSKGTWQEPGVLWNDMFTVIRISWSTSGSCSFNPPCRPFLLLGSWDFRQWIVTLLNFRSKKTIDHQHPALMVYSRSYPHPEARTSGWGLSGLANKLLGVM